ncbi:MAG: hypothetical protein JRJ41_10230 [Deltaproteobacteria bacterium]|nr:hypothetical protein [Deltaproteobacteria bacterium]
MKKQLQNATQNNFGDLIEIKDGFPDTILFWIAAYFRFEVTTATSSQKVQQRDLTLFRDFMIDDDNDTALLQANFGMKIIEKNKGFKFANRFLLVRRMDNWFISNGFIWPN